MSDIRINIHGGDVDERALIASATLGAMKEIGFTNLTLLNDPNTVDPLIVTDTRSLLDLAKQGRPDLFKRPIVIDTKTAHIGDIKQLAGQTCDRLLDSEEHAVESAIPQIAYDSVELIEELVDTIGMLSNQEHKYGPGCLDVVHDFSLQKKLMDDLNDSKETLHDAKELLGNLANIFHNDDLSTDEKIDQVFDKYPDIQFA